MWIVEDFSQNLDEGVDSGAPGYHRNLGRLFRFSVLGEHTFTLIHKASNWSLEFHNIALIQTGQILHMTDPSMSLLHDLTDSPATFSLLPGTSAAPGNKL